MTERHAMPARREPPDQIETAIQLGCKRHDADIWRRAFYLREYVRACELTRPARPTRPP